MVGRTTSVRRRVVTELFGAFGYRQVVRGTRGGLLYQARS